MMEDVSTGSSGSAEDVEGTGENDRSFLAVERRMKIIEVLNKQKTASVAELMARLTTSPATIRRDLTWLDQQGLVVRTHGGAMALDHTPQNMLRRTAPSYEQRLHEQVAEKRAIGRSAAKLIQDGEVIFLDSSSTNYYILPELAGKRDLTILTNSLYLCNALLTLAETHSTWTVICAGGTLFLPTQTFTGMLAEQALGQFFVDKTFLGARGLSLQTGLTSPFLEEIPIKRQMIKAARQVFVLADHTKFNLTFAGRIASIDAVQTLITDTRIAPDVLHPLQETGLHILLATITEPE